MKSADRKPSYSIRSPGKALGDQDAELQTLRSRVAELERREISQAEQNEEQEEYSKHSKIAQSQEIKQLKQHITYLDHLLGEKDKQILE